MADQQQSEQPSTDPAVDPNTESSSQSPTQSDAPVQAREQLQQVEEPGGNLTETLEQRASEQEAQQSEQLQSSLSGAGHDATASLQENASDAPAAARAGVGAQVPTQGGFVDQASRRSGDDAMEGHFVRIDLNFDGVSDAYEQANLGEHRGDYGVYLEPVSLHPETGIPEFALVRLRDETNARITVPYEALRPAQAGSR